MSGAPSASHSVSHHLRLDVADYDRIIRTFIPAYDTMLATIAFWVGQAVPDTGVVVDLGGGTGGLAESLLNRLPQIRLEFVDGDPEMLRIAETRLWRFRDRVQFHQQRFEEPLPPAAAVVASFALHHILELDQKRHVYANVFSALEPGGVFLNGDVTMSQDSWVREREYGLWRAHMATQGIGEEKAREHFAAWAAEDRYFSADEELGALRQAGFLHPECLWKDGPATVIGAVRTMVQGSVSTETSLPL